MASPKADFAYTVNKYKPNKCCTTIICQESKPSRKEGARYTRYSQPNGAWRGLFTSAFPLLWIFLAQNNVRAIGEVSLEHKLIRLTQ